MPGLPVRRPPRDRWPGRGRGALTAAQSASGLDLARGKNIGSRWLAEATRADWGQRVLDNVTSEVAEKPLGIDVTIERIWLAPLDGLPYLHVVHRVMGSCPGPVRRGLHRSLLAPPFVGSDEEEDDLALWLARSIAMFDLAEPLGRRVNELVPDEHGLPWRTVRG